MITSQFLKKKILKTLCDDEIVDRDTILHEIIEETLEENTKLE